MDPIGATFANVMSDCDGVIQGAAFSEEASHHRVPESASPEALA